MNQELLSLEVLSQLPLFRGMTDDQRQQLLDIASTLEFEPGEVALRQDKQSQNLLVVLAGKCQVVKRTDGDPPRDVVLAELKPHDHFGDMSFFHPAPHSASVIAVTKLQLLRFERSDYELLIQEDSIAAYKLAYNMVDVLADRLRKMDEWVSDLTGNALDETPSSEWSTFRNKLFESWNL
jgi:CRP-like cAMP-binding protein